MPSRRQFLRNITTAAAGALGLPRSAWTVTPSKPRKLEAIGVQLYTVRRILEKDFEGTLARIAAIGFEEVEFFNYYGRSPQEVKAALARTGLRAPAAHVAAPSVSYPWEREREAALTIGHRYLICAYLAPSERRTLDDYKRAAATFNRAGEDCRAAGLQFGYHNHDFEYTPLEGKIPYDVLLAETDPELVKMEMDLYWITKGTQDPLAYFDKHPGRFHLFHVKDMDNSSARGQTEVGRGIIDFKRIFAQAERAGVRHFFVERDDPEDPLASIRDSYQYLRQLEF